MNTASLHPELVQALRAASGLDFSRAQARPAQGGSIHRALEVEANGRRHFLKLNAAPALPMFEAELDGLAALATCDAFRVPRALACGTGGDQAFLLLEFIDLRPLASAEDGKRFAEALVELHRNTAADYGWTRDNFIGATPQANTPLEGWARFFIQRRLQPQLEMAKAKGFASVYGRETHTLLERVPAMFLEYCPQPSLLHGDLWHGNAAIDQDGRPVLFDPAVYRGDRDADLAMSELFGGFPTAFYAAYRSAWAPAEGYELRKTLYNLYHVLNHLNLFGRAYLGQAERMIRTLANELRQ